MALNNKRHMLEDGINATVDNETMPKNPPTHRWSGFSGWDFRHIIQIAASGWAPVIDDLKELFMNEIADLVQLSENAESESR